MRELFSRVGKVVLWLVGGGVQGIVWLFTALTGLTFAAGFGIAVNFLRDMSVPEFWLLVVVVFILTFISLNHLVARHIKRDSVGISPSQPQIAIHNYGQLNISQVAGAGQVDESSLNESNAEPFEEEAQEFITHASELPPPQELPSELVDAPYLEWESFYIPQLVRPGTWRLRRRIFENCRIHGPAILAVWDEGQVGGRTFVGCTWQANEDAFWELPSNTGLVVGTLVLEDCLFRECFFVNVGVLLTPGDYREVMNRFKRQRRELDEGPNEES